MFMLIYPQLCWLIALDMLGLSSRTAISPKPSSLSDKDE